MTKNEAQKILNQVREGAGGHIPTAVINAALHVTGDLGVDAGVRGEGLAAPVPRESDDSRPIICPHVVGEGLRGFSAYSWSRRFGRSAEANES